MFRSRCRRRGPHALDFRVIGCNCGSVDRIARSRLETPTHPLLSPLFFPLFPPLPNQNPDELRTRCPPLSVVLNTVSWRI